MKEKQIAVGIVSSHVKPNFCEFQFKLKKDYSKGEKSKKVDYWFIPVITFQVDGREYEFKSKTIYRGYPKLAIGESVIIEYEQNNPSKCKIKI